MQRQARPPKDTEATQKNELDRLVTALQNRLDAFETEVRLTRGSGEGRTTEVSGGRTIMRVSEAWSGLSCAVVFSVTKCRCLIEHGPELFAVHLLAHDQRQIRTTGR
eukprot:m51a1_g12453 hypothetical protein (107) ;mRNA; r:1922-2780